MQCMVSTTHRLLKEYHIRANRKEERAEATLFILAPRPPTLRDKIGIKVQVGGEEIL